MPTVCVCACVRVCVCMCETERERERESMHVTHGELSEKEREREGTRKSTGESFLNETMHPSIPLSLGVETDSISFKSLSL